MSGEEQEVQQYLDNVRQQASEGRHRRAVGGLWDEVGPLVTDYLVVQGLGPQQRLLDIGCGSLRVGVHLVRLLDAGNYYGIDASADLLDAGYDKELAEAGLQHKLPRANLVAETEFDLWGVAGGAPFDVALAISVFSHLPASWLRLCLERLAPSMRSGGVFHSSFFVVDSQEAWEQPARHQRGGITSHPRQNPFHYTAEHIREAAAGLPWAVDGPHDFGHPRAQVMVRFTRTA